MPRIFYVPPDDFVPLPEWMEGSRLGKSRKVGGGDGESVRLMKKRREEKIRRSRKEMERMRRYEESRKRKEKMVKDDRKRSTIAGGSEKTQMSSRKAVEKGQKSAKNDNVIRDTGKRWQLGDGFRLALHKDAEGTGRSKCERKNLSRRHRDARKESVAVEEERVRGKEKVKEWIAKVNMANPTVTNVQDVRSVSLINHVDRSVDVFDILSPWPISRYCLEDPDFKMKGMLNTWIVPVPIFRFFPGF
ncbi:protein PXR1-like [Haliotis rubra]|uniref:protein PXR1-like n=1 Tax=Haliotis rubra TaxID=36100 RepID=UPI001EE61A9C|nr:protein PXR1-like [Haliotis rubra]